MNSHSNAPAVSVVRRSSHDLEMGSPSGEGAVVVDGTSQGSKALEASAIDRERICRSLMTRMFKAPAREVKIGRYVVLRRLGRGAAGSVYLAHDPDLDREVALKVLGAKVLGAQSLEIDPCQCREHLGREARALARLSHENVVRIYEIGEHEQGNFIAMELIDGSSLTAWLEHEPRPWPMVLAVYREAGQGLAAAHANGVVHRDFKPDNVVIEASRRPGVPARVCVADFGVARVGGWTPEQTHSASVSGDAAVTHRMSSLRVPTVGTPAYMAPEQAAGRADARSDQYSFCVALYEGLFGEPPFVGKTVAQIHGEAGVGAPYPRAGSGDVPRRILRALQQGLSYEPSRRFGSMAQLLAALDLGRWRRMTSAGTSMMLSVGLCGWVGWVGWSEPSPPPLPPSDRCLVYEGLARGVWNEAAQTRTRQAIERTGSEHAAQRFERVDWALSEHLGRWAEQRTLACWAQEQATNPAEREPLEYRARCLDGRLSVLSRIVDALEHADARIVAHIPQLVRTLPSLQPCVDVARAPDIGAEAAQWLDTRLDEVEAHLILGAPDTAGSLIESTRPFWLASHWYAPRFRGLWGRAQLMVHDVAGRERLEAAARQAEQQGQEFLAWMSWSGLANEARLGQGDRRFFQRALNFAESAHRRLGPRGDRSRRERRLQGLRATLERLRGRPERARVQFEDLLDWADGYDGYDAHDAHDAMALGLEAARSLLTLAVEARDIERVEHYGQQVIERTDRIHFGNPHMMALARHDYGVAALGACHWTAAVQSLELAREQLPGLPNSEGRRRIEAMLANAYRGAGRRDDARGRIEPLLSGPPGISQAMAWMTRGALDFGDARLESAAEAMRRAAASFAGQQRSDLEAVARLGVAEVALHQGDLPRAHELLMQAPASALPAAYHGLRRKIEGLLAMTRGRDDEAIAALTLAARETDRCELAEQADVDYALGVALRRGGKSSDAPRAEALVRQAAATHARLGAPGVHRERMIKRLLLHRP